MLRKQLDVSRTRLNGGLVISVGFIVIQKLLKC